MLRRRQINADPKGRSKRFLLAVADLARWPFERLTWLLERNLIWPLREKAAGWRPASHLAGAGALAGLALAALLAGVLLLPGSDVPSRHGAEPRPVAIATPSPQPQEEEPKGPALQGVPPSFGVDEGVGVAEANGDAPIADDATDSGERVDQTLSLEDEAGATSSSAKPVPAGPAAMKVARRFADAFVFYEVGAKPARAEAVFGETATPELATALSERPPRLPHDADVPKARVVNLVPGPRAGKAYTVSVALLRVGLTSELRLELRKNSSEWFVTDVRG